MAWHAKVGCKVFVGSPAMKERTPPSSPSQPQHQGPPPSTYQPPTPRGPLPSTCQPPIPRGPPPSTCQPPTPRGLPPSTCQPPTSTTPLNQGLLFNQNPTTPGFSDEDEDPMPRNKRLAASPPARPRRIRKQHRVFRLQVAMYSTVANTDSFTLLICVT